MRKEKLINIGLILNMLGILLFFEAGFLLLSTLVALYYGERDFPFFLISFAAALATALICYFFFKKEKRRSPNKREGYLVVTFIWIVFSLFGSLPFFLSGYIPSYTDAFFETISGFTTTGTTILTDVESFPHGLLFWRIIIQWLGGMGIIVLSLAIMPIFGIGGMQMFVAEVQSPTKDKLRPRIAQTAKLLWGIYVSLTLLEFVLLYIGGMGLFDAICHAFSTISTGGFSTKNVGITYWNSPFIEYVIMVFMLIAGINYAAIYFVVKGNRKKIKHNEELRFYLFFIVIFSVITAIGLFVTENLNMEQILRFSVFHVISIMTGTGFTTTDYMLWTPFLRMLLFFIMLIGGCAGSATGGLKTIRVALLLKNSYFEFKRLLHPSAVIPLQFNRKVMPPQIITNLLAFISLYVIIAMISLLILALSGINLTDSVGAVIACLTNGIMQDNCAHYPMTVKWYLSFLMLIGRLDIFTVLFLFSPSFWKK